MIGFTPSDGTQPLARARRAVRAHLVQAAIFSALVNLLYLAPALYMLQVYDRVVPTRGVGTLLLLTLVFVFAVMTLGALDAARTRLLIRASARLDRLLAGEILDALLSASSSAKNRTSNVLREFDTFRQTMAGVGVLALFDAPWSPIYIFVCFLLHPVLGILALVCSGVLLLLTYLNERGTKTAARAAMAASNGAYQSIEASALSADAVRALGLRPGLTAQHLTERSAATSLQSEAAFTSAKYVTLTKSARIMMQSIALGVGAYLAIEQQISAGAIFAASLLVARALAPIESITSAWKNISQARLAYAELEDLFRGQTDTATLIRLPDAEGRITAERLSVAAPDKSRLLLADVSFAAEAGEMIGVVGPSGAGKTTLVRALVGIAPPYGGSVRLDGAKLSDWPEDQLTAAIGYVPQEPTLFRGSILENICRFQTNLAEAGPAVDEEVLRAAKLSGAHDLIVRLPQAYNTRIGAGGTGLSAGQAQRVALARALYSRPKVLVLDEPNSHLDAEGEAQLVRTLRQLMEEKVTIILVAHRVGVLSAAHKLLVLRDGKVDMFGPREDVARALTARSAPAKEPTPSLNQPAEGQAS